MAVEIADLDELQSEYKAAVERWVAAIRHEEALASGADHSVAQVDTWEDAEDAVEEAGEKARDAKKVYEDALREKFFHF
jgi:hypothetical protein